MIKDHHHHETMLRGHTNKVKYEKEEVTAREQQARPSTSLT